MEERVMPKRKGLYRFRIYWGLDRWLDRRIGDSVTLSRPSYDHAFMAAQKNPFPGATHFEVWQILGPDGDMEVFRIRGEIATPVERK
jgi:hypothetical protein